MLSVLKVVMELGEHGLVTCGADNMIIIWKVRLLSAAVDSCAWLVYLGC